MKKIIFILFGMVVTLSSYAGDGDTYFSLMGGALHKNAISVEFTIEKETAYHGGWEFGLDYYNQCLGKTFRDSIGNKIENSAILAEVAYKKVLIRYKNANIRWRLAAGVGADKDFTCSVTPGLEYNYTFKSGVQFFLLEKNQFSFWADNKTWFRCGLMAGIKIPF